MAGLKFGRKTVSRAALFGLAVSDTDPRALS
jgi:hypothetical protein